MKFFVYLQYILPKSLISYLMGKVAESKSKTIKNLLIKIFIKRYKINMQAALVEDPLAYETFNQFFIRHLKPELRPIDLNSTTIVSPIDGELMQIGKINQTQLLQAKNTYFDLNNLLGGQSSWTDRFIQGLFATLYLSPHHYHRVHMPFSGKLIQSIFIPGYLFCVNREASENIANLYSLNERLVCLFETEIGSMAVIFVGAMIVGSIQLSWMQNPIPCKEITIQAHDRYLKKGEELGFFKMGSTVILLFEKNKIAWHPLELGSELQMGQAIARAIVK